MRQAERLTQPEPLFWAGVVLMIGAGLALFPLIYTLVLVAHAAYMLLRGGLL